MITVTSLLAPHMEKSSLPYRTMSLVTSWDDGHPLDERLADLLVRFGLKATFFVPISNCEGRPVLSKSAVRRLDEHFEIGSHTLNHPCLTDLSRTECLRQVVEGKEELEQRLGHIVAGFCYPRGKWNAQVRETVVRAGFYYARTIENLRLDYGSDSFAVPTTIQFYPHRKRVLIRNFFWFGHYAHRFRALTPALSSMNWMDTLVRLLDKAASTGGILHVWGHSWEIEERGLWLELERFFALLAERRPKQYTISELLATNVKK